MDSSVHGIVQARILEWFAIVFSRGSSWPSDQTQVFHIVGRLFTIWANREVLWTAREFPRLNFIIFPRKRADHNTGGVFPDGANGQKRMLPHGLGYSEYKGTPPRSSFQKTEIPILPAAGSVDCWQLTAGLFSWNYSQPKKPPHQC